jgi:hypothetical protein
VNRFLSALIALILVALAPQRAAADPADIAAASRSVVRVVLITRDAEGVALVGHGSGFAVAPDLVITNAHVVAPLAEDESMRVGIVPSQGKGGWFAKVVAYSAQKDLALLRLSEPGTLFPATLFTGPVTDSEDVFAVGYPGNVDVAQGLNANELMSPISPVKTHGAVSTGRTTKSFDTILHTAPIGSGNSGGPLLDACGRVIGANSFGTVSNTSADSEFYFAVSIREITRFLHNAGINVRTTGEPCRSLADLDRAENERLAGERAQADEKARNQTAQREAALSRATREAELEVIASRENGMALTGMALLLALLAGGAGLWYGSQDKPRDRKVAFIIATLLVIGALVAWFTRPSISHIDERAQDIMASATPTEAASTAPKPTQGALVCVVDPTRSRVTVSDTADVSLDWQADGCVNGKTQYGLAADGWSRILVPNDEDTVSIASFDPPTRKYRNDRYLLDFDTMAKVREERSKYTPPACGGGEQAARALGESQSAVRALLPSQPNERLSYNCNEVP